MIYINMQAGCDYAQYIASSSIVNEKFLEIDNFRLRPIRIFRALKVLKL